MEEARVILIEEEVCCWGREGTCGGESHGVSLPPPFLEVGAECEDVI